MFKTTTTDVEFLRYRERQLQSELAYMRRSGWHGGPGDSRGLVELENELKAVKTLLTNIEEV